MKEITIDACEYSEIAKNTPVFNLNQLEYFVWVHLDPEVVKNTYIYDMIEFNSKSKYPKPMYYDRDGTCWVKLRAADLNKKPGQHIYKISFVNKQTDSTFSLYASYIIQDDNPSKPYIYMKRQRRYV